MSRTAEWRKPECRGTTVNKTIGVTNKKIVKIKLSQNGRTQQTPKTDEKTNLKTAAYYETDQDQKPTTRGFDCSSMEKELVDLIVVAKRAADIVAMKKLPSTDPEFSRCLHALNTLQSFSVSSHILSSKIAKCLQYLTLHPRVKIRTEATKLLESWKIPPKNDLISIKKPKLDEITPPRSIIPKAFDFAKSEDKKPNLRDKIREHITEALMKVSTEINDEAIKRKAEECDPVQIGVSIESIMYKKMGESNGKNKAKYRSIMFNLKDSNNPDLRRQVLLGEIKPEKLIEMTSEEMASRKRKMENYEMRLKGLIKCEINRWDQEKQEIC